MLPCSAVSCTLSRDWQASRVLPVAASCKAGRTPFASELGDYRVIYTVVDGVKVVAIERIRHRREVYR